jgi:GNAT superfamily N-acetyltransferase
LSPSPLSSSFATLPDVPNAQARHASMLRARLLNEADADDIAMLRDEVLGGLSHPDCYIREDDEAAFLRAHRAPCGETVGMFDGQRLVAYAMIGLPAHDDPANLAHTLGLPLPLRGALAHLASCMVHPDWRGLGLQRTLLGTRLALARSHGRHLCAAVVSLHNHTSRHNMLRRGLHLAALAQIDGVQRQIALIDLDHGLHVDTGDERLIDSSDAAAQRSAFAEGYVALGEVREAARVRLRFLRRLDVQFSPL